MNCVDTKIQFFSLKPHIPHFFNQTQQKEFWNSQKQFQPQKRGTNKHNIIFY